MASFVIIVALEIKLPYGKNLSILGPLRNIYWVDALFVAGQVFKNLLAPALTKIFWITRVDGSNQASFAISLSYTANGSTLSSCGAGRKASSSPAAQHFNFIANIAILVNIKGRIERGDKDLFSVAFKGILFALILASCAPSLHQYQERTQHIQALQLSVESRNKGLPAEVPPMDTLVDDGSSARLKRHQYRENHHPIDFIPAHTSNFPFPLYSGKVECLTCHVENHMGSQYMLRGGPYSNRREICFKCHYEEDYAQIYPHNMLGTNDSIIEVNGKPVCLVCHAKTPDPKVDRTRDVVFRADVAFLCWRCHSLMAQPPLNRHILMKPSANMLRDIEHYEREMEVTIPLVPRERITCSTCHNPHEKGVITYEPSARGADEPQRIRLQSPAICLVCHKM